MATEEEFRGQRAIRDDRATTGLLMIGGLIRMEAGTDKMENVFLFRLKYLIGGSCFLRSQWGIMDHTVLGDKQASIVL